MGVLLASIFFSSVLTFIFKMFPSYKVDTFSAIIYNYLTCYILGGLLLGHFPGIEVVDFNWFGYALFLGAVFIVGFNIVARTVQEFGITIATLMQKMSLILTVVFALIYFHESLNIWKVSGLLLALGAIYLVNKPQGNGGSLWAVIGLLPFLTWTISALIEIVLLFVQKTNLASGSDPYFVTVLFGSAGILGLLSALPFTKRRQRLVHPVNITAGVLLGIPNFFSIYFLMKLIDLPWEGSIIFPVNNVGIMIFSVIGALVIFREKLNGIQRVGLLFACISLIILGTLS